MMASDIPKVVTPEILSRRKRYIKKFRTEGEQIKFKLNDISIANLSETIEEMLKEICGNMKDTDKIGFDLSNESLKEPIWIPFMNKSELIPEMVFQQIEKVQQSNQEFLWDGELIANVTRVETPVGTGRLARSSYVSFSDWLLKKRSIIEIRNKDSMCMARSIVMGLALLDNDEKYATMLKNNNSLEQTKRAEKLHSDAEILIDTKCGIPEAIRFERVINCQIIIISKEHSFEQIYQGPECDRKIHLLNYDNHYALIKSMKSLLGRVYYCEACNVGYNEKYKHLCSALCEMCDIDKCKNGEFIYCEDCNRYFKGVQCLKNHTQYMNKTGFTTCQRIQKCIKCEVVYEAHKRQHECGEKYCKHCKAYVPRNHFCFMKTIKSDERDTAFQYIFFDFECIQDESIHKVNLAVCHIICNLCINDENIDNNCEKCGKREKIFSGNKALDNFCKYVFSLPKATIIAHNLGGYDGHFIMEYIYRETKDMKQKPDVILNGNKILCISLPSEHRFIDSLCFLPMSLSKLPNAFEIKEKAKGYFPHGFNVLENQDYIGSWPEMKYYLPNSMTLEERGKFEKWYLTAKNNIFDFQEEIVMYCKSDVEILRKACLAFRSMFKNISLIDPFQKTITAPSACNLLYRAKFLKPKTIGIIPNGGYRINDRTSAIARKWLNWIAHSIDIKHADNDGEAKIGGYKCDGYDPVKKTVYEFNGCLWHGCPRCYKQRKNYIPGTRCSFQEAWNNTKRKHAFLVSAGFSVVTKWECEFNEELKKNREIKQFVDALDFKEPLNPRHAFYGGRTNAIILHYQPSCSEKIHYVDVTSLYPYINKVGKYPIGHPTVITENFSKLEIYEGLIYCKVLPPKDLYHPVLPYRACGKLMFPLCATCAETLQQSECMHSDHERGLAGVWVTPEIKKAISLGYKVLKIYEIWHYNETAEYNPQTKSGGLFTEYINTFLKYKQQASGFPSNLISEEEKDAYISDYHEKEGIQLDKEQIKLNPGLRSLSKILLNSFWGKFGQRSNMTQTKHITTLQDYMDLMHDDKKTIKNIYLINDDMVRVSYQNKEDYIEDMPHCNIVIAAYTTALARLHLYTYLEKLQERVLYFDTDSVIYSSKEYEEELPLGNYLGDLTSEIPEGSHITEFVSGGPKNYSYKLLHMDGRVEIIIKVKGITLNSHSSTILNFRTMKDMVLNNIEPVIVENPNKIMRSRLGRIVTVTQKKMYQVVYNKRRRVDYYRTVPYGYKPLISHLK